jgi:flagellar biosynthetic protein FliO
MSARRRQWIAATMLLAMLAAAPVVALADDAAPGDTATRPVKKPESQDDKVLSRDGGWGGDGWLRTAGAMALVIGLIFLARYALRRFAPSAGKVTSGGKVEVLARTNLSARQQLCLVRMGRRVLLIGSGPEGMRTLSEVSDPAEVADLLGEAGKATKEGATQ